jgi:hypothetical protein
MERSQTGSPKLPYNCYIPVMDEGNSIQFHERKLYRCYVF